MQCALSGLGTLDISGAQKIYVDESGTFLFFCSTSTQLFCSLWLVSHCFQHHHHHSFLPGRDNGAAQLYWAILYIVAQLLFISHAKMPCTLCPLELCTYDLN